MRIAVDIDSTLHHHWPLVALAAKRRFGVELPYEQQFPWAPRPLDDEQLRLCIEDTHPTRRSPGRGPYPHAVETVSAWCDAGHRIHVMSHRDERSAAATRRWLHDVGLRHHDLYCGDDKVAHCRAIGIGLLIDDSPVNLLAARDAGILAVALRHPWNEDVCDARPDRLRRRLAGARARRRAPARRRPWRGVTPAFRRRRPGERGATDGARRSRARAGGTRSRAPSSGWSARTR